jgi:hypothetical protein
MSSKKRDGSHDGKAKGKKPRNDGPYDSDDNELPEESVQDLLKWRTDDSFADWKIVILVATTPPQKAARNQDSSTDKKHFSYNVRKCVLADGPRRSEYFVRLFENDGNFAEAQDKTSRIELNELQAKAFPEFLDNAVLLLDAERRIVEKNGNHQGEDGDHELSSLHVRCVNAIARGNQEEELRHLNGEWFQAALTNLPRSILCEIIKRGIIPPPL